VDIAEAMANVAARMRFTRSGIGIKVLLSNKNGMVCLAMAASAECYLCDLAKSLSRMTPALTEKSHSNVTIESFCSSCS